MRIELRAEGAADGAHLLDQVFRAGDRAGHQVAVAAHVFGQRIHAQVHAMLGRLLEDRAQQRVVAHRDRAIAVARGKRVQLGLHGLEVDQRIGGIGRRFHVEQLHRPLGGGRFQRIAHALRRQAVVDRVRADAPFREDLGDQGLGAAVQRHRLHQLVARAQERQEHRADGRHAAGGHRRVLRAIQQRQAILDDLQVGMVEAAVHQPGRLALRQRLAARHQVEELGAVLGRAEGEGGREEYRRLDRAFGQEGIEAVRHHLRLGVQRTAGDVFLVIAGVTHGVPLNGGSAAYLTAISRIRTR